MRALLTALTAVVPWIPAVPPPTPHPPLAQSCRLSQLRVHPFREMGATGWLVGGVTIRNDGPACSLLGRPRLVVTFNGRRITASPLRPGHIASQDLSPDGLPPTYSLRAVPTGAFVFFGYQWMNWCGRPKPLLTAAFAGGAFRFRTWGPACLSVPKGPPDFEAGRFVQWRPPPPAATELPFAIGFPHLHFHARAGGTESRYAMSRSERSRSARARRTRRSCLSGSSSASSTS
jgi:hypothetical protein